MCLWQPIKGSKVPNVVTWSGEQTGHPLAPRLTPSTTMIKSALVASVAFAAAVNAAVQGFDISHYQPNVNFAAARSAGAAFVIIKVRSAASHHTSNAVPDPDLPPPGHRGHHVH